MIYVTNSDNRDMTGLSTADEQLLKELAERAGAGAHIGCGSNPALPE